MKLGDWTEQFNRSKGEGKRLVIAISGNRDIEITDIRDDSREVSSGGLFVAIKGTREDGHAYIKTAVQKGASIIVQEDSFSEPQFTREAAVTYVRVADSRKALAHLAPAFFGHPADQLRFIGITGTNGKTTTAYLIHSILQKAELKTGLLSTTTYRFGNRKAKTRHTTPGLLELQRYFSEMRQANVSHVVLEVSSHALDQGRVSGCRFDAAVFTNLTQDHLDYHGSMTAYFEAKKRLFLQTNGKSLINIDDEWGRALQQTLTDQTWGYGIDQKTDIYPLKFRSNLDGIWMLARTPMEDIEITSPLIGRYNLNNLLAAIGVGLGLGLSKETITAGIASMPGVPGRFEKIDEGQDFTVVVDYAHTPDALFRLLKAIAALTSGEIITLFGCGGDRDRGKRPKMGAAAAALSQKIILTSDNPRSESPMGIIREIEAGIPRDKKNDTKTVPDRREAIQETIRLAKKGDIVVIAGKGHETEQVIGQVRTPFDDREVTRWALAKQHQYEKSNVDAL